MLPSSPGLPSDWLCRSFTVVHEIMGSLFWEEVSEVPGRCNNKPIRQPLLFKQGLLEMAPSLGRGSPGGIGPLPTH